MTAAKKEFQKEEPERMTVAERLDLTRLVRLRAKVVKADITAQVAQQLAHVEEQLAARYSMDHERWAEITKEASQVVVKADTKIAQRCREMGIPESFRPELHLSWYRRGENADKERRAELRRVAEAELEARAQKAKVAVDRAEADLLTQITAYGLGSSEARQFLENMPTIDALMPKLQLSELEERRPLPPAQLPDLEP